jgi:hypothetical protein
MIRYLKLYNSRYTCGVGCWWLMSVILASWETEIRRIAVQGQLRQIIFKTPSPK